MPDQALSECRRTPPLRRCRTSTPPAPPRPPGHAGTTSPNPCQDPASCSQLASAAGHGFGLVITRFWAVSTAWTREFTPEPPNLEPLNPNTWNLKNVKNLKPQTQLWGVRVFVQRRGLRQATLNRKTRTTPKPAQSVSFFAPLQVLLPPFCVSWLLTFWLVGAKKGQHFTTGQKRTVETHRLHVKSDFAWTTCLHGVLVEVGVVILHCPKGTHRTKFKRNRGGTTANTSSSKPLHQKIQFHHKSTFIKNFFHQFHHKSN